jgi:Tol biopolymer transport system component
LDSTFSPNSKRIAYTVKTQLKGGEVFVVVDGQEGKHYSGENVWLRSLSFSPDSKHVTYTVQADNKWFVVADGKEYPEAIGLITFSPDGSRIAYPASIVTNSIFKDKVFFMLDGVKGKSYDSVTDPVFSSDGKSFAYAAYTKKENKWRVVVNGTEGKTYDLVLAKGATDIDRVSTFDTSSLHFDTPDKFHYMAVSGKR